MEWAHPGHPVLSIKELSGFSWMEPSASLVCDIFPNLRPFHFFSHKTSIFLLNSDFFNDNFLFS